MYYTFVYHYVLHEVCHYVNSSGTPQCQHIYTQRIVYRQVHGTRLIEKNNSVEKFLKTITEKLPDMYFLNRLSNTFVT